MTPARLHHRGHAHADVVEKHGSPLITYSKEPKLAEG